MEPIFTVLLVEDYVMVQRAMLMNLDHQGCHTTTAETADEARQYASRQTFDLILMDVGLPDDNGLSVSGWIRSSPRSKNHQTPIIVLTAHYLDEASKKRCHTSHVNAVFQKPFPSEKLKRVIQAIKNTKKLNSEMIN